MSNQKIMFDPTKATELAKFQGSFAGTMAGHPNAFGVAAAGTEIFNQGGYYALQNPSNGMITLDKLGDDSVFSNNWYSQTTKQQFNFQSNDKSVFDLNNLPDNMTASQIAQLDK